jgi:hypothetical protein
VTMNETQPNDTGTGSERWWLSRNNVPEGPHSEGYVSASLMGGAITSSTLACPVGGSQWKPLCEWPQFREVLSKIPVSAMPPPPALPSSGLAGAGLAGLLTNPRLPRMANWICIYCLGVVPSLTIISLPWTFSGASSVGSASPAFGLAILWDLATLVIDVASAIVLFLGGLKLKRLTPKARWWAIMSFYVSLGSKAIVLLGSLFVWAVEAAVTSGASSSDPTTGEAFLGLFAILLLLAVLVFEVVALVWLHRHAHELPLDQV